MYGQCCRGTAVDCVRFVVAVMDELYGVNGDDTEPIPSLPSDASWNNPRGAMRVARTIGRRYPNDRLTGDAVVVEPGDVLVTQVSTTAGSPGHIAIVGPRRDTLWHANYDVGVVEAGIGEARNVLHAWRMKGKDQWRR